MLAALNKLEAAELKLAKPKRGPRTKGGIPTDVARGLKGARRPMPPPARPKLALTGHLVQKPHVRPRDKWGL